MDLSFQRFETMRAARVAAPLTYHELVASVAAQQAATRTAQIETRLAAMRPALDNPVEALVTVLAARGGPGEIAPALMRLGGSFHPSAARKPAGELP